MKLTTLNLVNFSQVHDLTPLKGHAAHQVGPFGVQARDLTPLEGMNLTQIRFTPKNVTTGTDVLRRMKSLQNISGDVNNQYWPAADFWKKYDAGEFSK